MPLATRAPHAARASLSSASTRSCGLCSLIGSTLIGASALIACSAASGSEPGGLGVGGAAAGTAPGGAGAGASAGAPTVVPTATPTGTETSPAPTGTVPPAPTTTPVPTTTGAPTAPTPTVTAPVPTGTVAPPAPTGTTMPAPTGTVAPPTPPPGTTELSLATTPFTLNPGEEKFKCQEMPNTIGKDVAIVQASGTMAKGSHHMFVYYDAMFNQTQALFDCTGTEFYNFLILTQSPAETQAYPAGVGRLLKSTEGFRFNMHYLNTTTDAIEANVTARFDYKDTTAVQHLAAQMELNNGRLRVPPGTSTASLNFNIPYDISLIYAISHMHKQGVHFKATAAGQTLYETTIWDEPVPKTYDPPLLIPGNSILTWACDYNNATTNTLTFGESAQTNEMCIFFSVFYATQASSPQGQGLDQLL
jgi:hypothetical protein